MRGQLALGLGAAAVLAAAPVAATAVQAAAQPARSIAVSVPSEPVQLTPGQTGELVIRVVDPSTTPVAVTVAGMGVALGDNGQVSFTGQPDAWSARTVFPAGEFVVPAMGYVDVPLTVHMPSAITPDLYYVGFVVRPVPTGSGVRVINEIGGFVTIDVPGPRARSLSADLLLPAFNLGPIHVPDLLFGTHLAGQLTVHNTGGAAVQFWGEDDASTWADGTPMQGRIAKSLAPIGRSRVFAVGADPRLPIDVVTMTVTITYPGTTESSTRSIVITRHVLVINPWVVIAIGMLVVALTGWRVRARRRRRARARARAAAKPQLPRAA